ncbi:ER membrane protein complex subunit 2-B-like [Tubulanus polymorphus]|uniref:ER membrane protein complex subunit 2-B-like n=1 Tax=Tubulanus polymorphus TaxID=672921 RepID=UPI003DA26EB1
MASTITWETARDLLKKFREDNVRNSKEIVDLWEVFQYDFKYKLGDEVWQVYEQVALAALDIYDIELAGSCIDALNSQFVDSLRVRKLTGMKLECQGRFKDALGVYESILEEDETNSLVHKRIVALYKAQNNIPDAISKLNKYLEQFMADYEAWMELCDLYLLEMDYSKAAFCMEEVLMSNPHNHLYHQRYAEIKYTQGGLDNLETARAYFSQAAKLNSNNMRALFGLFMAATNLAAKSKSEQKKENIKYAAWAAKMINEKYQMKKPVLDGSQLKTLESMLSSLEISPSV